MPEQQIHSGRGRTELALGLFGMLGVGLALAVPEARWVGVVICLLTSVLTAFLYRSDFARLPFWLFRRRVHLPLTTLTIPPDIILAVLVLIFGLGAPAYVTNQSLTTKPKQIPIPKLAIELSGRDELYVKVKNISEVTAHTLILGAAIFDLETPEVVAPSPTTRPSLSTVNQEVQFLKPFFDTGSLSLFTYPKALGQIIPGHRLFGYVTVDCSDCDTQKGVWIYMTVGQGGWYSPMQGFYGYPWLYNLIPSVAKSPNTALSFVRERRTLTD